MVAHAERRHGAVAGGAVLVSLSLFSLFNAIALLCGFRAVVAGVRILRAAPEKPSLVKLASQSFANLQKAMAHDQTMPHTAHLHWTEVRSAFRLGLLHESGPAKKK